MTSYQAVSKAKEMVKLGINEAKKNKGRNAFDAFEVAKNLDAGNYAAWLYLGNIQEQYGFTVEAEISYHRAASLPDDKHNNDTAKRKFQELRMKETMRQAEVTLKEAKETLITVWRLWTKKMRGLTKK